MQLRGSESVKKLQEIEAHMAAEKACKAAEKAKWTAFDELKNWCLKKKDSTDHCQIYT